MSDEKFYSRHLYFEPERLARFRNARDGIEGTKGSRTVLLEFNQPWHELGEVNFGPPVYSREQKNSRSDSDFLVLVGLQSYRLKYGSNRIGRFVDNDIVLDDIYVSRRHCCIVIHSDGRAELFDTASKNHTWVNGEQINRCWLKSGDEIRLAKTSPLMISLIDNQNNEK